MERAAPHPVPAGPLAVRWLGHDVLPQRAGSLGLAVLVLENAGSATWRSLREEGIQITYHWLDPRGNPIVWDGLRTALPAPVSPGARLEARVPLRAPARPGHYRLSFDLVDEGRIWFADVGNAPLELAVTVEPRIAARTLAVTLTAGEPELERETRAALAQQEEPLVPAEGAAAVAHLAPGCLPPPDWSRRLLDAHAEGFAAVGGSIETLGSWRDRREADATLQPWAPGSGRRPNFPHPLLCPSLTADYVPRWAPSVLGLPALEQPPRLTEPWLYDGRIGLRLRLRSDRRRG